jgi:hypothetical protein
MTGFTSLCHSFLRGPRLVKTNPTPLIRMIQQIPPISFHTAPFFLASLVLTDINQNQLLVLVPEDSKHIFHVDAGGNRDLADSEVQRRMKYSLQFPHAARLFKLCNDFPFTLSGCNG